MSRLIISSPMSYKTFNFLKIVILLKLSKTIMSNLTLGKRDITQRLRQYLTMKEIMFYSATCSSLKYILRILIRSSTFYFCVDLVVNCSYYFWFERFVRWWRWKSSNLSQLSRKHQQLGEWLNTKNVLFTIR